MRRLVPLLFLLCSFSLLARPGDVPLSAIVPGPLTDISTAAVATSGDDFLVAFSRLGLIYWQRVALDGSPIDPRARLLGETVQGFPVRAAWNGSSYLLVWIEGEALVGQHIGRDGTLSPRLTIAAANVFGYDVLGGRGDTAVVSIGQEQRRVHVVDAAGSVVSRWPIADEGATTLVRVDDDWRLLGVTSSRQLFVLDPETGTKTLLPARVTPRIYASPFGGALIVSRDRQYGVVTPAGEFKTLALGGPVDLGLFEPQALASPTPEGWTLFYRSIGDARLATVLPDGTIASDVPMRGSVPMSDFSPHAAAAGPESQRILVIKPAWPGLDSVLVRGTEAARTPSYALGDAAQDSAVIARGPGVDLVVWREAAGGGWMLRATRVAGDRPLDGEGIVISASPAGPPEAAFDGTNFAIVWDQAEGTFLRRIGPDGRAIEPAPVLLDPETGVSTIASAGSGELLVGWQFGGRVAMLRNGVRVSGVSLWPEPYPLGFFEAVAFDDSYLVVFVPPVWGCNFTCPPIEVPIQAQRLARDGSRIGAPLTLGVTDAPGSLGEPVAAGEDLFFPWPGKKGPEIVRVGTWAPLLSRTPALWGALRTTVSGIEMLSAGTGSAFRQMLSRDLETLWYEQLPATAGDTLVGILSSETSVLVENDQRYFLRKLGAGAEADIAVVHRGRRHEPYTVIDDVTIEHRGGDPVNDVFLWVWGKPYVNLSASRPMVQGRIEGPFLPGESIDVSISGGSSGLSTRVLIALPGARDGAAANNVLEIAPNGPVRERRRAVAR